MKLVISNKMELTNTIYNEPNCIMLQYHP